MKFVGNSVSVPTLCFALTAVINAALLCGTMYKTFAPKENIIYSYTDRDSPLLLPSELPTVEMTFQESARFNLSDKSTSPYWFTLFHNKYGIGFTHQGPFWHRFVSASYHSLHCIYNMQQDFENSNGGHHGHANPHYMHCLWYLKSVFLCNADITLEEGDFMKRNYALDRVGETRQCRDWSAVTDWVGSNFMEWALFNGVEFNSTDYEEQ